MPDVRWWRFAPAVVAFVVVAWVLVSRWDVILASHPAYLVTILVVLVVAAVAAVSAVVSRRQRSTRRAWVVTGRVLALLLTVVVVGGIVYLRPFPARIDASDLRSDGESVVVETATRIELGPRAGDPEVGLVFWPGARVDARAYVPLLRRVAEAGALVVIVKEPFGISFADPDAASDVIADHPDIRRWIVGGHSLGGVTASSYAGEHAGTGAGDVAGLLLWASYPLDSLADRGIAVTSVSGTRDGLSTPSDIAASRAKLPPDTTFVAVRGAVHAYFGDYGPQPGDGTPTISRSAAQQQIVAATEALVELVGTT